MLNLKRFLYNIIEILLVIDNISAYDEKLFPFGLESCLVKIKMPN